MANGHVEIHDPFSDQHGIKNSSEFKKSTSESTEEMVEFRILMAYAQRRRPNQKSSEQDNISKPNGNDASGSPSTKTEEITVEKKKKKKKKVWRRLSKVLICLKPQTVEQPSPCDDEEHNSMFRSAGGQDEGLEEGLGEDLGEDLGDIAARLAEISADIPFVPPQIETDAPEDVEVEKVIGLLLRDAGDRLNETELKGTKITDLLGNYNFFERVILSLLSRMGLGTNTGLGPNVSPKTQIAVACEATTRLSVLDTLPMNRLLGHGARFLNSHFSSWVEQQGGYEKAFNTEEDDEVH